MTYLESVKATAEYIRTNHPCGENPIGIVLGTGLGALAEQIIATHVVPYEDIPNFPKSTVEGHDGKLIIGKIANVNVVAMKGRFHYYEGYDMNTVAFPIRVMHFLGVKRLLLSNASGGMNPNFKVGDIMALRDQINLFPSNPLMGPNIDELGPRFPDMSEPYDHEMLAILKKVAAEHDIQMHVGVYAGVSGPCFETPAEYKYIRTIGADAVGMSTVPENIAAKHMGMRVAALSVITDLGVEGMVESVSHEEVQMAAKTAEPKLATIVVEFLKQIA